MTIHALMFVLGVWLFQQMPSLPYAGWLLVLIPLIFLAVKWLTFRRFLIPVLIGCVGFAWAAVFAHVRLSDSLPPSWEQKEIRLQGVVSSLPQQFENGVRFEFDVERVLTPEAVVPQHISLSQYSTGFEKSEQSLIPVRAGERWQLLVKLKRPHGLANPHGFDFEAWALARNIRATGNVRLSGFNQRISHIVFKP